MGAQTPAARAAWPESEELVFDAVPAARRAAQRSSRARSPAASSRWSRSRAGSRRAAAPDARRAFDGARADHRRPDLRAASSAFTASRASPSCWSSSASRRRCRACDHGYVLESGRIVLGGNARRAAGRSARQAGLPWSVVTGSTAAMHSDEDETMMTTRTLWTLAAAAAIAASAARRRSAQRPKEVKVAVAVPTVRAVGAQRRAARQRRAAGGRRHQRHTAASRRSAEPRSSSSSSTPATPPRKRRTPRSACSSADPDLVGGTGAFVSSFTLAVTEVTERAEVPWLTLSYSDQITNRGYKYVFQTSPTASKQAEDALPVILALSPRRRARRSRRPSASSWTTPRRR